jgi:hypothetical protein
LKVSGVPPQAYRWQPEAASLIEKNLLELLFSKVEDDNFFLEPIKV